MMQEMKFISFFFSKIDIDLVRIKSALLFSQEQVQLFLLHAYSSIKKILIIVCFLQFNSLFKTPDHWYMRYNKIIYKLQWFTGEGHRKGEARYNKCKKRKNKYKIHANVVKKSQEERTLFRIF